MLISNSLIEASRMAGGFHRPPQTMGDLGNPTMTRPTYDDSPDLDQRTPAEVGGSVAEPDDEQEPR